MAEQRSVRNVVQRRCGSNIAAEAKLLFDLIDEGGNQPIVLIPRKRHGIKMFLTIPAGCACIVERNGVKLGEWAPGRHKADWRHRVAFVVTQHTCTYNYTVPDCATRDDVMARVDLTLVFNIDNATTFVYKIGATHFNEMLKAVAEEALRGLVRSIDHTSIYELRSSAADQLLSVLNRTFKEFGVLFVSTTVTNVLLPADLSQCLEEASKIDSQIHEATRSQEFKLKKMNDQAELEMKEITLQNEREDADLIATRERLAIEKDAKVAETVAASERAIVKERQVAETRKVKANAALRDEQTRARTEVEKMLQKAEQDGKKQKLDMEKWANGQLVIAEAELQQATSDAKILKMEADSEAAAVAELRSKREYELQLEALKAIESLAASGKIVLAGKSGQQLLDALVSGTPVLGK